MPVAARTAVREATRRSAGPVRRGAAPVGATKPEAAASFEVAVPQVVTVFRDADNAIHHRRCGRVIEFVGIRGGVEYDFYCLACREHITLTDSSIARMPVGPATA